MDSFKAPSRPFESSLKRSRTVGTSQVKRGGLGSILLLVFLFFAWPFCHPSTQRSPGCLTVYGWIDQSNDAWKSNIGGGSNSQASRREPWRNNPLCCTRHITFFLGWFLANVSARLLRPSSAERSQHESTFFLQSWNDFPMWSARMHTVTLYRCLLEWYGVGFSLACVLSVTL